MTRTSTTTLQTTSVVRRGSLHDNRWHGDEGKKSREINITDLWFCLCLCVNNI